MVAPNKHFCLAEDIVKRIHEILLDTPPPDNYEDLTLHVAPEIPLETKDLPFIAIYVREGDAVDQTVHQQLANNMRYVVVQSVIALNFRVDVLNQNDAQNNGIKALAPLRKWAMRHLMNDPALKLMSMGPIIPTGWIQYGDTHETAAGGAIQYLQFRHTLDLVTAWDET